MTKWIRADHAQAEQKAAVKAAVSAEREAVAYEICELEEHDAAQNDWTDGAWLAKRIASAIRARAGTDALEAVKAEARAEARQVKPLVWEYHPAGAMAAPPTGHAYIIDTRMKSRVYSIKGFNPQREFASIDEAKAAAQADYEHRILSALIPADQEGDG